MPDSQSMTYVIIDINDNPLMSHLFYNFYIIWWKQWNTKMILRKTRNITKFLWIKCCTIIKTVIYLFHIWCVTLIIKLLFVGDNKNAILYDLTHNIYVIFFHVPIATWYLNYTSSKFLTFLQLKIRFCTFPGASTQSKRVHMFISNIR